MAAWVAETLVRILGLWKALSDYKLPFLCFKFITSLSSSNKGCIMKQVKPLLLLQLLILSRTSEQWCWVIPCHSHYWKENNNVSTSKK
eukprot:scaffold2353_cov134-Cylindrotheca_fusiformis.AAC.7